jgi:hypothetical protein
MGRGSRQEGAVRICVLFQTHSQPGDTALLSYRPCSDQYEAAAGAGRGVGRRVSGGDSRRGGGGESEGGGVGRQGGRRQ